MNTENTYTTIEPQTGGTVKLSHNYPSKPSWKVCGQGRAIVDITANPDWPSIDLHCSEVPEYSRGTKEVYVTVPVEAVIELLKRVGYTVLKTV